MENSLSLLTFLLSFMHLHPFVRVVAFAGKRNRNVKIKVNEVVIVNKKEPGEFC